MDDEIDKNKSKNEVIKEIEFTRKNYDYITRIAKKKGISFNEAFNELIEHVLNYEDVEKILKNKKG